MHTLRYFRFIGLFILIWINLLLNKSISQTSSDTLLIEIRKLYQNLEYSPAEIKTKQALLNYNQFTTGELVELHKYLALIYFAQNKLEDSRQQFKTALELSPGLVLSPLYVSPKIIDFFNRIKLSASSETKSNQDLQVRYIIVKDRRFPAVLRSTVLPGWGQVYKGDKKKGITLISLWSMGLSGLLITQFKQSQAKQDYLDAVELAEIESRYKTYNNYYKTRNSMALFMSAVWLYAYFDAGLQKAPNLTYRTGQNTLGCHFDNRALYLCYQRQL